MRLIQIQEFAVKDFSDCANANIAGLFVADVDWGAGAIERKDLDLPLDRDGRWRVAHGFVAGLIFELAGERERFSVFAEGAPELGAGADFYVLADAEGAFVDGDFFLDCWQIQSFGCGIDC